uniref:C2H2-type domain-containing protein n=1 Tax=Ciona savignyi TaxID=51511 RepID=H2Z1F0_CIOSA
HNTSDEMKTHTKRCVLVVNGSSDAKSLAMITDGSPMLMCTVSHDCAMKHEKQHDMYNHIKSAHSIVGRICKYCPAILHDRPSWLKHKLLHQTYLCQHCEYSTTSKNRFVKHFFQVHHSDLKCQFCNLKFLSKPELVVHQELHVQHDGNTQSTKYKCLQCKYVTPHKEISLLKKHIMRKHGECGLLQCTKCDYTCTEKYQLNLHMRKHSSDKPYLCQLCGFMCKWSSQMSLHQAYHKGLKLHKCPHCQYKSYRADTLKIHLKHKHGFARSKLCEKCGYTATCASSFNVHMAGHSKQRPYVCQVCEKTYKTRGNLRSHQVKTHENKSRTVSSRQVLKHHNASEPGIASHDNLSDCNTAEKEPAEVIIGLRTAIFEVVKGLITRIAHIIIPLSEVKVDIPNLTTIKYDKPMQCSFCSFESTTTNKLYTHMSRKHKRNKFECSICDAKLKYLSQFLVHRLFQHEGVPLHSCSEEGCSYVGLTKKHLHMHSRTHSDSRRYRCEKCGFTCKWANMLTLHEMQKHSNNKKYACETCEYKAYRKDLLQQHMINKHSTHRPNTCGICGRRFKHRGTLIMHQSTHKPDRQWVCETCGKSFKTKRVLQVHKKTHVIAFTFLCNYCKFRTNAEQSYHNHTQTHIQHFNTLPHKCTQCIYAAKTRKILNAHKKKKHTLYLRTAPVMTPNIPLSAPQVTNQPYLLSQENHPRNYESSTLQPMYPVFTQLVTVEPHVTHYPMDPQALPHLYSNQEYGSRGPIFTAPQERRTPLPSSTSLLPSNTILLADTNFHRHK